jgi:3-oxoacyl-[acyl-carrier protein] reductase
MAESGKPLAGRVALVTGAGGGIGLAVAERLATEGAAVIVNDLDGAAAEAAAESLGATGAESVAVAGSVADPGDAAAAVALARDCFGGLDILVNNAGVTRDGPLHRMPDEDWKLVQDVVLWGAFCMCRAAAPLLRGERGDRPTHNRKVINMSSSVALHGTPGIANYTAAKAGLIGLTRALGREWASAGVNVNAVAPGLVAGTGLTERKPTAVIEEFAAQVPLGRPGTPEDVAGAVAFLASPDSDYMVGQVLELHGGLEAA